MKVVFVVNDATLGGAQTFLCNLASSWCVEDEIHLIVLLDKGPLSDRYDQAFATTTYLSVRRSVVSAVFSFRRALARIEPDVVHSHLLQADLLNNFFTPRRYRKFTTHHTTGVTKHDPLATRLIVKILALFGRRFEQQVLCDASCAEFLAHNRFRTRRVTTIENGIPLIEEPADSPQQNTFINVARFHPMKDHKNLLLAFERFLQIHPGWLLRCLGEGVTAVNPELAALLAEIEARSPEARNSISLEGANADPVREIAKSSALVISSAYGEAAPVVALEAASVAVPIISTRVGGAAALCESAALSAAPGDPAALAVAMGEFASLSADRRREVAKRTWKRVHATYDIRDTARRYRLLYESHGELL